LVDINTANSDSFVAVIFIEEGEVVEALGEKLENGLGASSVRFVSVFSSRVFDF
jgi:hypothetical protein